ncbi:hypothetical protein FHK07_12110 [Listeria monocytogenes]|nr:hypothetical protein [Listeria monocytogenes]EJM6842219.1 hypothetical protein [Listeria monocytogenes]
MTYIGKDGKKYLIYQYSEYRNIWKIENVPFDNAVREVTERSKDVFIRNKKLKKVSE